MTQSYFCVDASDNALFMAKPSVLDRCHPAIQNVYVETTIIEPTQPIPPPFYLKTLSSHGFKSKTEIAAADAFYQEMEMSSQRQHERDLPLIIRPGARVCTREGGKIIYGWVEEYVAPNLKLRIYGWGTNASRNVFIYPREQILWAPHFNWNLCD